MFIKTIKRIQYIFKKILFKFINFELFFHKAEKSVQKKLLIIRIDSIGDFIIFSPMLKYYRKLYSDYSITLLVNKVNQDLAQRFNQVDEIMTFDRKRFDDEVFYRRRLLLNIKKASFNIAIYPTYSREPKGDYLIKVSGAREKIGLEGDLSNISMRVREKNNKHYTKLIKLPSNIVLEIERNKKVVELLGSKKIDDYIPSFSPSIEDEKGAVKILLENNISEDTKFIVVCPGAGSVHRIWPLNKFSQLINWLGEEKNLRIVICGSPDEKYLVDKIKENIDFPVVDIVGQTDLLTLSSILKKAILYVGSDNGITHLSAAVGIPTVCLIGGGHPGRFFSWGGLSKNKIVYHRMPCFGCDWFCKYDAVKCVRNISMGQVIDAINQII